jgi:hypothetical protein
MAGDRWHPFTTAELTVLAEAIETVQSISGPVGRRSLGSPLRDEILAVLDDRGAGTVGETGDTPESDLRARAPLSQRIKLAEEKPPYHSMRRVP